MRRRFGVWRSSVASLSIAGELYDVPRTSAHALSFGRVALRGEEIKFQNLQAGARDYDDVHRTAGGHGAAAVATSIAAAVVRGAAASATLADAAESCRRDLQQRKLVQRTMSMACRTWV